MPNLVYSLLLTSMLAAPLAVFVDGPAEPAVLRAVADGRAVFSESNRSVDLSDLVEWGQWAEPGGGPWVLLADGGLVVADVFEVDKEQITLDSPVFGVVRLKLDTIAGVVFTPPLGRLERDRLVDTIASTPSDGDWLVLDNGDRIDGAIESIADDQVTFRAKVGPLTLPVARLAALGMSPSLRRRPGPAAAGAPLAVWLGFSDGSRLRATGPAMNDKTIAFTAAGQAFSAPSARLAALMPLGPRVVYLSDLAAAGYRHVPYLDLAWDYARDRSVSGGWLRSGGRPWLKGLGMHSASRLSYAIPQGCRRFEAAVGIDDGTEGGGSVRFRVFVDGRERLSSETIRGRQPPLPIAVDVTSGKRLDLVVDYADRADVLDRALWLGARLVR